MANGSTININYPFKNSDKGYFLDLTTTDAKAIKADLMHLILTRRGQRYYMPDFGTDLLKFIFEPNDSLSLSLIKEQITTVVKKYLPMLKINEITVENSDENEYVATVRLDYSISNDVFVVSDNIIINI